MEQINKIKIFLGIFLLAAIIVTVVFYFSDKSKQMIVLNENTEKVVPEGQSSGLKSLREIDSSDNVWGSESAPVEIIVYSDFECPFCANFSNTLNEIKKNYPDKVKIAFRHYFLITHTNAIPSALASECAGEQGRFWEMHDRLFADNQLGRLNDDQYEINASALGLDLEKFKICRKDEKYKGKIMSQVLEAESFGVTGTPTIYVNNNLLPGAYPFEDFIDSTGVSQKGLKSIIEEELNSY